MRTEKDSLGTKGIPDDAYYGIQTKRAIENFPISGVLTDSVLIHAYALVKCASAETNAELGILDKTKARAIIQAAREIGEGNYSNQFFVDVFQAGAGTSLNMNLNEVIANRALEILGKRKGDYVMIHPNDHVNMSQSTNDTFPTAMRIAALMRLKRLYPVLEKLVRAFCRKGKEFDHIIKSARTHLQDAVPIRLGQEFSAYGKTLQRSLEDIQRAAEDLQEVGIGGTAAGTGINTHPRYQKLVVRHLNALTKLDLKPSDNLVHAMQSQQGIAHISSALKNTALEFSRITHDLMLLSSGPHTGLRELTLPQVQPGSSIMPGKVNPSILECVRMVCFHVMGADHTISLAVQSGEIDLNVYMPLMAYELLFSIEIFENAVRIMEQKCVRDIKANKAICEGYVTKSPSLVTALNPMIGYAVAAEIAKECIKTGRSIEEIVLEKGVLTEEQIKKLLNPHNVTKPNLVE